MSERLFALGVSRPVLNIGLEHILPLEKQLCQSADDPVTVSSVVSRLFKPVETLHAGIVAKVEFQWLQQFLGDDRLDKRGVKELARHIEESVADRPDTYDDIPTLPARLWRKGDSYALTIADSPEVVSERAFVQKLITDFVNHPYLPDKLWLPNRTKASQVWFATTRTKEEARLVGQLDSILAQEATEPSENRFLPEVTKLGKIDVIHSSRKV